MRVGVYAGAMLIALSGAIVVAQNKVTTPEEFDKYLLDQSQLVTKLIKAANIRAK